MPLIQPVRDLIVFSDDDDDGDLINFSDTANAAKDLFDEWNLSDSFSWLFGLIDSIDIEDIITAFSGLNVNANDNIGATATIPSSDGDNKNDDNCDSLSSYENIENEWAMLSVGNTSPLSICGTDWSFECKRIFGHLDNVRRRLDSD